MITVVARWDSTQMSPEVEHLMWRQLKGAFAINAVIYTPIMPNMSVNQYATMDKALAAAGGGDRVFLEPTGNKGMGDIPAGDIVIVVGNTNENNLAYAQADEIYQIACEGNASQNHLFGTNAVAIALGIRYGQ